MTSVKNKNRSLLPEAAVLKVKNSGYLIISFCEVLADAPETLAT